MALIQDPIIADAATVSPTMKALSVARYPPEVLGAYRMTARTGTTAAATAAGMMFSFRYYGSGVCAICSIRLSLNVIAAYTQNTISYGLYMSRSYLTTESGGTVTAITFGAGNKVRTTMPNSNSHAFIANNGTMVSTAGSVDTIAIGGASFDLPAAVRGQPAQDLLSYGGYSYVPRLLPFEGFQIRSENAYGANGTSNLQVTIEWLEQQANVVN